MNTSLVFRTLGLFLVLLAVAMFVPLATSAIYREGDWSAFVVAQLALLFVGGLLYGLFHAVQGELSGKDACLLVSLSWLLATIFGALPLYLSGGYVNPIDAWFETASGFTTTGASVMPNVEGLSHAVLIWRSLTQLLGGMGIILLSIAVLPLLGVGGMELYRKEVPGPTSDKISSRVSETARILWVVYLVFTVAEVMILWFLGMSFFDALNHAMTTMATGGFSTKNSSIGAYDNAAIEGVITFFMFCAGMNFLLHYRLIVRQDIKVFENKELKFYTIVLLCSVLLVTINTWTSHYSSFFQALRFASFQVVSIATTTGFATADFAHWMPFSQLLLLLLMIMGGCSGSTAGGIKCVRAMMLLKQGFRELFLMVHPKAVMSLKLEGRSVSSSVVSAIFANFFLYIVLLVLTCLFITGSGVDLVTAVSGTTACLSNVGPGLGTVGPTLNYAHLGNLDKVLLSCCMIVGRLEIFTVLVLFTGEFWKS